MTESGTLWCVEIIGPDDLHACRDVADAFRFALWLNMSFLEDLARRDREKPRWAEDWRQALCGLAEEVLPLPGVVVDQP